MSNTEQDANKKVNPVNLPVPEELPVLPLHGFVFFPGMGFPMQISHPSSMQLVDDAILKHRLVAVVTHRKVEEKDKGEAEGDAAAVIDPTRGGSGRAPNPDHLYPVGVVGYIHKLVKSEDGVYQVLISAVKKLRLGEITQREPYLIAKVEPVAMGMLPMERLLQE